MLRRLGPVVLALVGVALAIALLPAGATAAPTGAMPRADLLAEDGSRPGASTADRYSLAGGCFAISSADGGASDAGPLFLKAADLGEYLLHDARGRYLTAASGVDAPTWEAAPSEAGIWRVADPSGGRFAVRAPSGGRTLGVDGGALVAREGGRVRLETTSGCRPVAEASTGVLGAPRRGVAESSEVVGSVDPHEHYTAWEFLGGNFHCGTPFSRLGVAAALPDCAGQRGPGGTAAPLQGFVDGTNGQPYDTVGWPTFRDWPSHEKLSFEQTYYRWLERNWRGGERLATTNLVENNVLCALMTSRRTTCGDMDAVRLQRRSLQRVQDYVDAQSGGPGRGWFRIVRSPFQARRVINEGRLAVRIGVEVSNLFECARRNGRPTCTSDDVTEGVAEMRRLGVTSVFPVHKFDNAFGGTQMDREGLGPIVNLGNLAQTGSFWDVETCTGPDEDSEQPNALPAARAGRATGARRATPRQVAIPGLTTLPVPLPLGPVPAPGEPAAPGALPAAPVYPPAPHCNRLGLSALGEQLLRELADADMLIEIDHMDARTADAALRLLEERGYSGVVSSHSWEHARNDGRILRLGGFVGALSSSGTEVAQKWERLRGQRDPRFLFGYGFGADQNGLASQPVPRPGNAANPVRYPFTAYGQGVRLERQRAGERTFDVNRDGVAQQGMLPDLREDLRMQEGEPIARDLASGAEAYLQTWERARGIPAPRCQPGNQTATRARVGRIRLDRSAIQTLRAAGQPQRREGRTLRWCTGTNSPVRTTAVIGPRQRVDLVATNGGRVVRRARVPRAAKPVRGVPGVRTVPFPRGVKRYVYVVRKGRVRAVAAAAGRIVDRPAELRRALREAGVR